MCLIPILPNLKTIKNPKSHLNVPNLQKKIKEKERFTIEPIKKNLSLKICADLTKPKNPNYKICKIKKGTNLKKEEKIRQISR
jgi:hypothetical protein